MKTKTAKEIFNVNGIWHCKYYLMNGNAIRIDYVSGGTSYHGDLTVEPMIDSHIVYGKTSFKAFITDCRKNGIVVSNNVIAKYRG